MQWRTWRDIHGVKTEVAFDHSSGTRRIVARQTIQPERLNNFFDVNEASFNTNRVKELVRGNTQKHRIPVACLPEEIYWRWRRELGNPHIDYEAGKRWKARLNDHNNRVFRVAEGHI